MQVMMWGELVPVSGVTREPVRTRAARRCLPNRVLREPAVLRPTTVQMRCAANVLLVDVALLRTAGTRADRLLDVGHRALK